MKPIMCIDLETTSLDVATARIIEIAIQEVDIRSSSVVVSGRRFSSLVNPQCKIPKESIEIHGITNEMVNNKPTFLELSFFVRDMLSGCDLLGFGIESFDVPVLWEEFNRCGMELDLSGVRVFDACSLFRNREPRTLDAAIQFYLNSQDRPVLHRAMSDCEDAIDVFLAQLSMYKLSLANPDALAAECQYGDHKKVDLAGKIVMNKNMEEVWNFGRHKGCRVIDDISYCHWVLNNDFPENVKYHVRRILGI